MQQTTDIHPDLAEKVIAFVDREAGRGAPLSFEDEAHVQWWLARDLSVRTFAEDCEALNTALDGIFDSVKNVEVPSSLVEMIHAHNGTEEGAPASVVPLRRHRQEKVAVAPRRSYGWLAAAASFCLLAVGAGAIYQKTLHDDELRQVQSELADMRGVAEEARAAKAALGAVNKEFAAREAQLAQAEAAIRQDKERIRALESDVDRERVQSTNARQTAELLLTETERLQEQGSWIQQVAGYHRGYAGTMREVELTDADGLSKWLGSMFRGRSFSVPDLSLAGLTFVGGRVFFVNGMPTGQIAYHDPEGRLLGFCFTQSGDNDTTKLALDRRNDLNLAHWRKAGLQYVLVGWTDIGLLGPIAEQLRQNYGDEV